MCACVYTLPHAPPAFEVVCTLDFYTAMIQSLLTLLVWLPFAFSFTPAGLGPRTPVRSAEITVHTTTMGAEGPSSLCSDPWSPPHTVTSTNAAYSSSSSSSSRGEVLRHLGRVVAGAGVFSLVGTLGGPPPALADNALIATKQSYFRYVPRIQDAMAWYNGDLQSAIVAEDWSKVLGYFEVASTARADSSRPAMYQSSSSRMQRELFSPLSVWAQSMSIKGTGAKLRALLAQEELLEKAMARLEKAASGKGLKEGESQFEAARGAWEAGRDSLQEYIDVANKGMVRSLRKVDTPFSK